MAKVENNFEAELVLVDGQVRSKKVVSEEQRILERNTTYTYIGVVVDPVIHNEEYKVYIIGTSKRGLKEDDWVFLPDLDKVCRMKDSEGYRVCRIIATNDDEKKSLPRISQGFVDKVHDYIREEDKVIVSGYIKTYDTWNPDCGYNWNLLNKPVIKNNVLEVFETKPK